MCGERNAPLMHPDHQWLARHRQWASPELRRIPNSIHVSFPKRCAMWNTTVQQIATVYNHDKLYCTTHCTIQPKDTVWRQGVTSILVNRSASIVPARDSWNVSALKEVNDLKRPERRERGKIRKDVLSTKPTKRPFRLVTQDSSDCPGLIQPL